MTACIQKEAEREWARSAHWDPKTVEKKLKKLYFMEKEIKQLFMIKRVLENTKSSN